jgi:hypothetical protein
VTRVARRVRQRTDAHKLGDFSLPYDGVNKRKEGGGNQVNRPPATKENRPFRRCLFSTIPSYHASYHVPRPFALKDSNTNRRHFKSLREARFPPLAEQALLPLGAAEIMEFLAVPSLASPRMKVVLKFGSLSPKGFAVVRSSAEQTSQDGPTSRLFRSSAG